MMRQTTLRFYDDNTADASALAILAAHRTYGFHTVRELLIAAINALGGRTDKSSGAACGTIDADALADRIADRIISRLAEELECGGHEAGAMSAGTGISGDDDAHDRDGAGDSGSSVDKAMNFIENL